jgi:hypothetical protein
MGAVSGALPWRSCGGPGIQCSSRQRRRCAERLPCAAVSRLRVRGGAVLTSSPRAPCPAVSHEAHGAVIREALFRVSPPGVIFAPRRRAAVLLRLHTADHIRLASAVREPQFPRTSVHRTPIMRFAIGDAHDAFALVFQHRGRGIFSVLLRLLGNESGPMRHLHAPSHCRIPMHAPSCGVPSVSRHARQHRW